ncbi:MAG: hypothetical protein QXS02_03005 [Candidatus Thermoplasmatota archaeon]
MPQNLSTSFRKKTIILNDEGFCYAASRKHLNIVEAFIVNGVIYYERDRNLDK